MFLRYYPRLPPTGIKSSDYICELAVIFYLSLFAFNHQNQVRYLTQHHVELTSLSITKPQGFSDLETFGLGASRSRNKILTIPRELVTEVTINREVKVRGGPMRGGQSTSIDAENDFILNSHMLAELKNKINSKTDPNHKKLTTGCLKNKKNKQQDSLEA